MDDGYASLGGVVSAVPRVVERRFHRAVHDGWATGWAVDEVCCAFGFHPAEVYGDMWWDTEET